MNASFEDGLNLDENLQRFSGRICYVWDDNHQLQAWMPYISRVHPYDFSLHIVVDSIMLDMREGLVHLLIAMIRHEQVRLKFNIVNFKVPVLSCY
jgi:hypothetical protein